MRINGQSNEGSQIVWLSYESRLYKTHKTLYKCWRQGVNCDIQLRVRRSTCSRAKRHDRSRATQNSDWLALEIQASLKVERKGRAWGELLPFRTRQEMAWAQNYLKSRKCTIMAGRTVASIQITDHTNSNEWQISWHTKQNEWQINPKGKLNKLQYNLYYIE